MRELFCFVLYVWYRLTFELPVVSSIYFHDPSPKLFEMVLKWYKKHHYRVVSLEELEGLLEGKKQPQERVAYISFDDGKRSNLDLLPLCEKYDAPITVFAATEPLTSGNYWWEYATKKAGRAKMLSMKKLPEKEFYAELAMIKEGMSLERTAMTIDELKMFANHPLITIQSHTVNHPVLTTVTDETLKKELKESKLQLEEITGEIVDVFSYPNGNVSEREINALKDVGYRYAFTTEAVPFDIGKVDPFMLPRMAMNTNGGKYDNLAKLTGIWYNFMALRKKIIV